MSFLLVFSTPGLLFFRFRNELARLSELYSFPTAVLPARYVENTVFSPFPSRFLSLLLTPPALPPLRADRFSRAQAVSVRRASPFPMNSSGKLTLFLSPSFMVSRSDGPQAWPSTPFFFSTWVPSPAIGTDYAAHIVQLP